LPNAPDRPGQPIGPGQRGPHRGVWLGVDVGTVRVGVARSDPGGVLATPLVTLDRDARTGRDLDQLADLVREYDAVGVVVGDPITLRGHVGPAAMLARTYARELAQHVPEISVELVDERLTTVVAARTLGARGVRRRAQRAVVDQAAAVVLLQHWLDSRSTAGPAGDRRPT
jgi:putative holliday junction resolvase